MSEKNVAVVTGGSGGIGKAICQALLGEDYEVVSLDRVKPDWSHARFTSIEVDLLDAAATHAAAQAIGAERQVSHLVHNAGIVRAKLLAEVSDADLHDLTQLHLGAGMILLQAVLPGMQTRGFGRVVLISSRAALGVPTRTAYAATKAGMIGMARTWALELAASGITVNVVAPGPIEDTQVFASVMAPGSERALKLAETIPVKRLGRSCDVAHAVKFFAAREAGFITGQVLYVCGGASIGAISL
jgi:NAD(P)-dependent dehydrogenase (short-subunit alcohol dehydrogenase family)